jgi:recombination protein RecT
MSLPKHLTPDRFARVMLNAINRNPKIANCTQESVIRCMMDLSAVGLEPDGRMAHLIPYGDQLTLIVDYKGFVQLCHRIGVLVEANKVCRNDYFEWKDGRVSHGIDFSKPRGEVYAYWARGVLPDRREVHAVMTKEEVDAVRARSRSANNGPWVTDYDEMAKKTVFRRLTKWLPTSPEMNQIINVEDEHERAEVVRPVSNKSVSDQLVESLTGATEPDPAPAPVVLEAKVVPQETPASHTKAWWTAVVGQKTAVAELDGLLADLDSDDTVPADVRSHAKTQIAVARKSMGGAK